MTKNRLEGSLSMTTFRNHVDPEKEEQLRWVKLEIENKVKRIVKLSKTITHGNKDANLKKKSELIHLVEEFHEQYESLYSLYEDLRGEVKSNIHGAGNVEDTASNSSASDSEAYYSPLIVKNNDASIGSPRAPDLNVHKNRVPEAEDSENTILKDKLTSSSEVKETRDNYGEILKDVAVQDGGLQKFAQIKELEGEVTGLRAEIETICAEKRRLEEQVEKILRLEARVLELEGKEEECRKLEEKERGYLSRISDLVTQANNLRVEATNLNIQKRELEDHMIYIAKQDKELHEKLSSLEEELVNVNAQKSELEETLRSKSTEVSERNVRIESLRNEMRKRVSVVAERAEENEGLKVQVKDLENSVRSLSSEKSDMEEEIKRISDEAHQSKAENQKLQRKILELEKSLLKGKDEVVALQKKFKDSESKLSSQIETSSKKIKDLEGTLQISKNERSKLQVELEALRNDKKRLGMELEKEKQESKLSKFQMENKSKELSNKISEQQKALLELEKIVTKLRHENEQSQIKLQDLKTRNFQMVEKKIEKMAEEFREQFEDKYRILSRRIRVAEQLHVENKDFYKKTKDAYEKGKRDLKERDIALKNVKDISLSANDVLDSLDSVALKFEECTGNFLNRISKASCELKFAKDWAMRKNKALSHVKDDLDCLLKQLDDKEAEILVFRGKVWKSENKVRELEKMIKEKDDVMVALKEEKREAIRQLCVWIDHHRSRSDYYKKVMMSEMNPAGRWKASSSSN